MVSDISRRAALLGLGATFVGAGSGLSSSVTVGRGGGAAATAERDSVSESDSGLDWPMERYDAAGTGYDPDASGPKSGVRVAWKQRPDGFSGSTASPILVGDTVYATGGRLVALDAATGEVRFSRSGSYRSSLARADASAYTTDTLAVTAPTGVYGLHAGGGIEVFGRAFGVERWHGPGREPWFGVFGPPSAAPPVAVGNRVYAAIPGTEHVVALDASSGRELWRRSPGDELRRPAVRDGIVFAVNWPSRTTAYDAATGDELWQRDLDEQMVLAPTAANGAVVVPRRSGVTALEASDGSVRWRFEHGGNVTGPGAAAVAAGRVYVQSGLSDDTLYALDLETGDRQWSVGVVGDGTPVVADGVVYASGYERLAAIDATTGDELWRHETRLPVSTAAVGDGAVYAVSHDTVLKLEEPR